MKIESVELLKLNLKALSQFKDECHRIENVIKSNINMDASDIEKALTKGVKKDIINCDNLIIALNFEISKLELNEKANG